MKTLIQYYYFLLTTDEFEHMNVSIGGVKELRRFDVYKGEPLAVHLGEKPIEIRFDSPSKARKGKEYSILVVSEKGIEYYKSNSGYVSYRRDEGLHKWRTQDSKTGTGSILNTTTEEERFQDMTNENIYGRIHDIQQYLL
ncbi:hypothetical protein, partial [Citrobacter sp. Igbk 16]|uniref:hypothetical protein n=1 Tax=Citrobacter sp. Igbk 16 TaxID=2963958 RepID=UPI00230256B6